uniref:SMP-30/Gluconolactonase/LRE-like region domain-containing protein n=1 Tax=viral metagenome TaxID=1070528 RepID=A0A6C0EHC7_9ZZZZ
MIIDNDNILGESPLWNYMNQTFYWVDINNNKIKSLNDHIITEYTLKKKPTCLYLLDINKMVVAVEDGIGIYDYRISKFIYLKKIDDTNVRCNDGKCDRNGNIYIGTMDKNEKANIGAIYKFNGRNFETIKDNICISNGLAFNSDNKLYACDSLKKQIFTIKNKKVKIINTYYDVNPDGATIDKMDNYYSCLWGGSRIDIYNKNNSLFNQIDVPFTYPTCCCFGGVNMNKLLITSSSLLNNNNENGKLLLIDTKYTGVNESIANI